MRAIFEGAAEVVAEWVRNCWSGDEAFAYRFHDGSVAILTDYFGSCCVCDSWVCASDEDARSLVSSVVSSARVFSGVEAAARWCSESAAEAENYTHRCAAFLAKPLAALSGGGS